MFLLALSQASLTRVAGITILLHCRLTLESLIVCGVSFHDLLWLMASQAGLMQYGENLLLISAQSSNDFLPVGLITSEIKNIIRYDTIRSLHSKADRTCQFSLAHKN